MMHETRVGTRSRAVLPPGPPGVFGIRNVLHFAREQLVLMRDLADEYGDIVHMKVLGRPFFLISHPDDVEAVLNLHQEISRVTMEVVAEVLFGAGIGPDDVATVRDAMEVVNEYMANSPEAILKLPGWVPTPRNIATNRAVGRIDELVFKIIAKRRAGEPRDDLLGTLLAAQDEDGSRMTDQQLRDEVITLFLAGHETTAPRGSPGCSRRTRAVELAAPPS